MNMGEGEGVVSLLGGRLAVDFANVPSHPGMPSRELSWEELISFLEIAGIVSKERGTALLSLPESDPRAAGTLLGRATRLRNALRQAFGALVRNAPITPEWTHPINDI